MKSLFPPGAAAGSASEVLFETGGERLLEGYSSAVSLHSHTLYSRESLEFIAKMARSIPVIRAALQFGARRYREVHGTDLDLRRGWWTPPVAPHDAWLLEKRNIEERLGVPALVSLTDHDDIEAPVTLRVLEECRDVPVSVEWTVPFGATFFHLGLHNLPAETARVTMAELADYTADPRPGRLRGLLEAIAAHGGTLVVFNHPLWDENRVGSRVHRDAALALLAELGGLIHALELNGLRPWSENRAVLALADAWHLPPISGGDRHCMEPNTLLNLTTAQTFAEFVAEIRDGRSRVLVTEAYRECMTLRVLHSIEQVLANNENHGLGWKHWDDRVFYVCDDGVTRPLRQLWGSRLPWTVDAFVGGVRLLRRPLLRGAFRSVFGQRQEIAGL